MARRPNHPGPRPPAVAASKDDVDELRGEFGEFIGEFRRYVDKVDRRFGALETHQARAEATAGRVAWRELAAAFGIAIAAAGIAGKLMQLGFQPTVIRVDAIDQEFSAVRATRFTKADGERLHDTVNDRVTEVAGSLREADAVRASHAAALDADLRREIDRLWDVVLRERE